MNRLLKERENCHNQSGIIVCKPVGRFHKYDVTLITSVAKLLTPCLSSVEDHYISKSSNCYFDIPKRKGEGPSARYYRNVSILCLAK